MSRVTAADRAVERWGERRTVVVAARDVPEGARLRPGDVAVRSLPAAIVAPSAFAATSGVVGRVSRIALVGGQPIEPGELGGARRSTASTRIGRGRRGMAIPIGAVRPALERGDLVDLIATSEARDVDTGRNGVVANDVEVIDVHDQSVTVAIDAVNVERVAAAIAAGTIVVALRGN